ncbi:MAG: GNAT family N-acetyltransferase [Candidatus Methanofastidiosia archaeon]|jgi:GNAT superfamily N-acetyltransferase
MNVRDVVIKPAEKEEAVHLAAICKRAFETDVEVGSPGPGGPPGYDTADAQIRLMKIFDYFTILLDTTMVGGIIVGSVNTEHKVLERIFVDPDVHRHGIGTKACQLLWECYPDVKLWTLGTPEWNTRTNQFYEKLGFTQIGWDLADPDWRGRWYQWVVTPSDSYELPPIKELKEGMRNVTVEGEIKEVSDVRMVRSRKGKPLSVVNAAMEDKTGRIVLVLWNEQIKWITVGDRIRVENGYVNAYRGVNQLNVGRVGRLIVLM